MTTPLDRKVRQLDNDVEAIYGLLSTIETTQKRQLNRLAEIENRLTDVVEVQDRHSAVLAEHGTVLAEHSTVLAEHSAVLADHSAVLAEHTTKLDRIIALLERR